MKKHRFKLNRIVSSGVLVGLSIFLTTCELEQEVQTEKEPGEKEQQHHPTIASGNGYMLPKHTEFP